MQKNFDLDLKGMELQIEKMTRQLGELTKQVEVQKEQNEPSKEFYTINEIAAMKGGCALNTVRANKFLQVGCGNPKYSVYIAGRLAFPRKAVERWLRVTDADLLDYAKECGITVIPEKYKRLALKAQAKNGGAQ